METITEQKKERVLYFRDTQAENRVKLGAECAAIALNNLFDKCKFLKTVSEVEKDPHAWAKKMMFQNNKKLAQLATSFQESALKLDIPDWIAEQRDAMISWNDHKNSHTQFLQYTYQEGETFKVNYEQLENLFETNDTYRKYFTGQQLVRLEYCKTFIKLLNDAGFTYPSQFITHFKQNGCPFARVVNGKYVPNKEYVLDGTLHPNAPMYREADYILESVLD